MGRRGPKLLRNFKENLPNKSLKKQALKWSHMKWVENIIFVKFLAKVVKCIKSQSHSQEGWEHQSQHPLVPQMHGIVLRVKLERFIENILKSLTLNNPNF